LAYKGRFSPKNPKKYRGDPTGIIFRSLWERKVMMFFDETDDVLEWSSEEIVVPYISPIDNRTHRYFPDFLAVVKTKDGTIKTRMIEVKPKKQTVEPKVQSKRTKKYITEVMTWGVNSAKWHYAREYCLDRGWEFIIMTEDHIGIVGYDKY
jgi:hypothetical protein